MTGHASGYATPEAMSLALTAHLRRQAAESAIDHSNLRRQFAYDRLLARVFASEDADWVLKGGTAMLARLRTARHTLDIDLARRSGTVLNAVEELTGVVKRDLGDHFRFALGPPSIRTERPGQPDTEQATLRVTASIGAAEFARFSVDIVVGSTTTAAPEAVSPAMVVGFDGLTPPTYLLYPVVDHIADKVCATFETHGPSGSPSSRSRDLVDLVLMARTQVVEATTLRTAIEAERLHRGIPRIEAFVAPAPWRKSYPREARNVPLCEGFRTLDDAVELVARLLDPALSGVTLHRVWNPETLAWH